MKCRTRSATWRRRPRAVSASSTQVGRALSPSVISEMRRRDVVVERELAANGRVLAADRAGEALGAEIDPPDAGRLVDDRAEREIELAGLEHPCVAAPGAGHDLQRDPGRLARDGGHQLGEDQHAQEVGRRDHEVAHRRARIELAPIAHDRLCVEQHAPQRQRDRLGAWRERHSAPGANQQRIVEQLAQLGQRVAHRRRRHVRAARRPGDAAFVQERVERAQEIEVDVGEIDASHAPVRYRDSSTYTARRR